MAFRIFLLSMHKQLQYPNNRKVQMKHSLSRCLCRSYRVVHGVLYWENSTGIKSDRSTLVSLMVIKTHFLYHCHWSMLGLVGTLQKDTNNDVFSWRMMTILWWSCTFILQLLRTHLLIHHLIVWRFSSSEGESSRSSKKGGDRQLSLERSLTKLYMEKWNS